MSLGILIQVHSVTLIQNMFALYSRGGLVLRRGLQLCLRAQHSIWAVERVSVLQGGGTGSNPVLLRTSLLFCTFLFGSKNEVFILHANAQKAGATLRPEWGRCVSGGVFAMARGRMLGHRHVIRRTYDQYSSHFPFLYSKHSRCPFLRPVDDQR